MKKHSQVLDLRDSPWVTNHSLMAICKIEELRELDLRGCFRMGECFAYTALACRFGFRYFPKKKIRETVHSVEPSTPSTRKVEKLDLRDTSVGDQEAACFSRLPELRQLVSVSQSLCIQSFGSLSALLLAEMFDIGLRLAIPPPP